MWNCITDTKYNRISFIQTAAKTFFMRRLQVDSSHAAPNVSSLIFTIRQMTIISSKDKKKCKNKEGERHSETLLG